MAKRPPIRPIAGLLAPLVASISCAGCVTDRPASTWTELERLASTYPVPTGFTVMDVERKGELCRMPTCEKPRVALRMAVPEQESPDALCASLRQSLDLWEGFVYDVRQSADPTGCSMDGKIDGRGVNAFVLLPETGAEQAQGVLVIVSVWA